MRFMTALIICLLTTCASGCKTWRASNATACRVGFDYKDPGVNDQNARALLKHYCLCKGSPVCQPYR